MRTLNAPHLAPKPVEDGRLSTPYGATFSRKREKGVVFIRLPRADRSAGIIDGRERLDKLVRTLRVKPFSTISFECAGAALSPF
jgi:hypothetical protein